MPPKDKDRVSPEDQRILRRWIAGGLPWEDGFSFAPISYEPPLKPRRPELPLPVDGRLNPVDRILDADLAKQHVARPHDRRCDVYSRVSLIS